MPARLCSAATARRSRCRASSRARTGGARSASSINGPQLCPTGSSAKPRPTHFPYGKWVGRGFAELPVGHSWGPLIDEALLAPPVLARDEALQRLLLAVAAEHNRAGISDH